MGRGDRGGATRNTAGKCGDQYTIGVNGDGGDVHTEERWIIHMGKGGVKQAQGKHLRHAGTRKGMADQRDDKLRPEHGKFYVDNGVKEVARSRGLHTTQ